MRAAPLILSLALLLSACADPFSTAQKADTIEAWETFIAENPDSPRVLQARNRAEELLLEKARTEKSLAVYDEYMEKYPKGNLVKDASKERRELAWEQAAVSNTPEAWQKIIDVYAEGDRKMKKDAQKRLNMAQNISIVTVGPVSMEQVNLAEMADGPLDGWGFYADVTVAGDKEVKRLVMEVAYLGASGEILDKKQWPLVAPALPGNMPVEESFKVPMKPGETRTFEWTSGDMPPGWAKKATITPVDISFVSEAAPPAE